MNMAALKYLAAFGAAFVVLFAAYSFGQGAKDAEWQSKWDKQAAELSKARADATDKARTLEGQSAQAMQSIDKAYQQGKDDAQTTYDRTIADRDSGAISLRERFTCTTTAASVPKASTSTSQRDAASARGLQRADEEFFVREAKRADDYARQLMAAQKVIISMQSTCQGNAP